MSRPSSSRSRWYWFGFLGRTVRSSRRQDGRRSTHARFSIQRLEQRLALSASPTLVRDINAVPTAGGPHNIVSVGSFAFFTAPDAATGDELWKTDGTADGTVLVKDINPGGRGSNARYLTSVGSTLYFTADDDTSGQELWKSDGTAAGTVLVKDLKPGSDHSSPTGLTAVGSTLYFTLNDDTFGPELWKSDGTAAGTVIVKHLGLLSPFGFYLLTAVGSTLYFTADDGTSGQELWKTDGTAVGTVLVKDIKPGSGGSYPQALTAVGSTLYFTADDGTSGRELWKTDGTAAGTALVKDITPGSGGSYVSPHTALGSTLYFTVDDGTSGQELWKTDGTAAGTVLVKDIKPGSGGSFPRALTAVGSTLYFTADDGTFGRELWKTDGTAGGTSLVKDIEPGSGTSFPNTLTAVGSALYFTSADASGHTLWKTDGNTNDTSIVNDLSVVWEELFPGVAVAVGATLYFVDYDSSTGCDLWKTDGSPSGTVLVKDINAGATQSSYAGCPAAIGSETYFPADDGTGGTELWKTDGTAVGTVLVKDINPGSSSSSVKYITAVGSTLYFQANDGTTGAELWKSDGTSAGTVLVKDLQSGADGSKPKYFTAVGSTVYFTAAAGSRYQLWKSDGTEAGTVRVKDLNPWGSPNPGDLTAVGSTLYFRANDGTSGYELWKSDGTEAGTVRVKDINPGSSWSFPWGLEAVGSTLYFSASNGTAGQELWKTDGTATGIVLVKDIKPGEFGSYVMDLTAIGSTLYFTADNGTSGQELWKSDGTAAGTVLVKDIKPGSGGSSPQSLTAFGATLYFTADDGTSGQELWRSDGTANGTVRVKDIAPGNGNSDPLDLTSVGSELFFTANDGTSGRELWKSDGTAVGTIRVRDINPFGDSSPAYLRTAGSTLFFQANDGITGRELWSLAPAVPPIPPTNVVGLPETGKATLTWTAPVATATAPITDYVIQYSSNGGTTWTTFDDGTSMSTAATVTGLVGGRDYVFCVAGVNSAGTGESSVPSATVSVPAAAPAIAATGMLATLSTTYGTASTATSVAVSGASLVADLVATAPSGFEVSTDTVTYSPSTTLHAVNGEINGTVYVRLAAKASAGSYAGNLTIASPGATSAVVVIPSSTVSPKIVTVSGIAIANKVYDGATSAAITGVATYSGLVGGESFLVVGTPVAAFADKNVGAGKFVTVSGYAAPSANYTLASPAGLTANITPKPLTFTGAVAQSKDYDGTTAATITVATLAGVVDGDLVTVGNHGTFARSGVGSAIVVAPALVLGGTSAANYVVTQPTGLSAAIRPKLLTVTGLIVRDKIYDRKRVATVTGAAAYAGLANGESFAVVGSPVAVFDNKNAGASKPVTISGFRTPHANYTVNQPVGLTATIAVKPLLVASATATSRVYNGTTMVVVSGGVLSGVVAGDAVVLGGAPTGMLASADVGSAKAVTVTGYSIGGVTASNYTVVQPTGLRSNIAPRSLTIAGMVAHNKLYDGTSIATLTGTPSLVGKIGSDDVAIAGSAVGTFATKNAGVAQKIAVGGLTLTGSKAINYRLSPLTLSGSIVAKTLMVRANDKAKLVSTVNPPLSATISGFVVGETAVTALTGAASLATAATSASPVGTYTIQAMRGSLAARYGNYVFSFGVGALKVISVPGAPTGVTGTAGDKQVALNWSAPAVQGNSEITDYVIEYRLSRATTWTSFVRSASAATSAVVTGLESGKGYEFRVSAKNAAGKGIPSAASAAVTTFVAAT